MRTAHDARGGLAAAEAARLLRELGPNTLPAPPRVNPLRQLSLQFVHLFALMLWVSAALALLAGMPQLAAAIVVVVVINGVFAFIQEHRADNAAARLRDLVPAQARVLRDGARTTVPVSDVVVGDLLLLEAGERICADAMVNQGHALAVDESLLTGESLPARPTTGGQVWCGSFVVEGEAEAVATSTGQDTALAGIARMTQQAPPGKSPLTRELHRVVRTVAITAAVVGAALSATSIWLGLPISQGFLFGLGVTVALVPEGLLPTVTLSLARAAQRMADRHVLVRRLEAVETLGATTFICTDKTGTLTLNEMSATRLWIPGVGQLAVDSSGYDPTARPLGDIPDGARGLAQAAASCVRGRAVRHGADGLWRPQGDPMEVALDVLARRLDSPAHSDADVVRRLPYTAARLRSSVVVDCGDGPRVLTLGSPEAVARCLALPDPALADAVHDLASTGLRVLAVAHRPAPESWAHAEATILEAGLLLLGLIGLEDPPRPDVAASVQRCLQAGIRVAVVTGDHPATATAIARQVGLAGPESITVTADSLPGPDNELAELLTRPGGIVVARVRPEGKLRIAMALRKAGEVVAMTGDGVNDGPALRAADVGVAMGASGSDVAREAADIVLLDDHFASIVTAVELGRATFSNIRRFLTYHLTDNVAELTPFVIWALSAGQFPLAIGVLQVLALDIGTDMLPALALGAEPPNPRTLSGAPPTRHLIDRALVLRAFGVLGPVEALGAMLTFTAVLLSGGWNWGSVPAAELVAAASGSAFAAIAAGQLANAVVCRSSSRPAWVTGLSGNPLLVWALVLDALICVALLALPPLAGVLGGTWPPPLGLLGAALTAAGVFLADAVVKTLRATNSHPPAGRPTLPS